MQIRYSLEENRGVIRDMYDVAVKVLSALSGLVFPHGWESPRLTGGTPTRVHGRAPRSCACTRMHARLGRGRGSIPRSRAECTQALRHAPERATWPPPWQCVDPKVARYHHHHYHYRRQHRPNRRRVVGASTRALARAYDRFLGAAWSEPLKKLSHLEIT